MIDGWQAGIVAPFGSDFGFQFHQQVFGDDMSAMVLLYY